MSITEDIYSGFFKTLDENEDFPRATIVALRQLMEKGIPFSEENINLAILEGEKNDSQN